MVVQTNSGRTQDRYNCKVIIQLLIGHILFDVLICFYDETLAFRNETPTAISMQTTFFRYLTMRPLFFYYNHSSSQVLTTPAHLLMSTTPSSTYEKSRAWRLVVRGMRRAAILARRVRSRDPAPNGAATYGIGVKLRLLLAPMTLFSKMASLHLRLRHYLASPLTCSLQRIEVLVSAKSNLPERLEDGICERATLLQTSNDIRVYLPKAEDEFCAVKTEKDALTEKSSVLKSARRVARVKRYSIEIFIEDCAVSSEKKKRKG